MELLVWPAAAVVAALLFMIVFRASISGLVARIKRVGASGVEVADQSQQPPVDKAQAADALLRTPASRLVLDQEETIKKHLREQKIDDDPRVTDILIRQLATAQVALVHEFHYGIIFGSQLEVLRVINGAPNGLTRDDVRPQYDAAATQWPDFYKQMSFDAWLGFLLGRGFVFEESGRLHAAEAGKDFMRFLVTTSRSGFKAL